MSLYECLLKMGSFGNVTLFCIIGEEIIVSKVLFYWR